VLHNMYVILQVNIVVIFIEWLQRIFVSPHN